MGDAADDLLETLERRATRIGRDIWDGKIPQRKLMSNLIDNPTGVSDLNQLPPDTNMDFFVARLAKVETKSGKRGSYYNCRFESPDNPREAVYGNAFTKYSPYELQGKVVVVEGAQRTEWNGKITVTVNKNGVFSEYKGSGAPTTHQSPQTGGGRPSPKNAPRAPESPASSPSAVHGATACWAVGKAVEMVIADKAEDIETTAYRLLAIQRKIEQGQPGPIDEDVPF